jgi:hypothetical protein
MALTLLKVVQDLLSDSSGDEVSSISDTTESMQAATLAASVYEDIVTEHDIQAVKRLMRLDGVSDLTRPTHMKIPEGYHSVEWVKYDKRLLVADAPDFRDVCYLYPVEFMAKVNSRPADGDDVFVSTDFSGVSLNVMTNSAPTFFTMFDNEYLVFDSYNAAVESTLHQTKTQAYGQMTSQLVLADATEIVLPSNLYPLFRNELRTMYFDIHGTGATPVMERAGSRARVRMQRLRHTMRNNKEQFKHTGPDYGRRPK